MEDEVRRRLTWAERRLWVNQGRHGSGLRDRKAGRACEVGGWVCAACKGRNSCGRWKLWAAGEDWYGDVELWQLGAWKLRQQVSLVLSDTRWPHAPGGWLTASSWRSWVVLARSFLAASNCL